jgi:predicted transcriptional regulator
MDVSQLIQQKLSELGLDQRDLADAAEVTESYDKLGRVLKLPVRRCDT